MPEPSSLRMVAVPIYGVPSCNRFYQGFIGREAGAAALGHLLCSSDDFAGGVTEKDVSLGGVAFLVPRFDTSLVFK